MATTQRLSAVIQIGGAINGTLKSALGTTKSKLLDLGGTVRKLEREQRMLGNSIQSLGRAGMPVDSLRAKYKAVTAEIDKQRAAMVRLKAVEDARAKAVASMSRVTGMVGSALAAGVTVGLPIVKAAKFETAMLGVAKQVDGARDSAGRLTAVYFDMAKRIQTLSTEMPVAAGRLAEMAAAGARMGVARNELIAFTTTAAKMSEALELPAGELAENMGKIAGLYKIPIPAIGELADTINFLDDQAISKGGDIIDFMKRVGGVAGSVKVTGSQMAALGSTLLTLGETAETAGTATNAMLQKFAAADKGTKKFHAAMKEIGLSTAAVQKGMQADTQGTILKVLEAVNKLPAEKRLGILVDLVGFEHSDTLAKLATNTEEYRRQINLATNDIRAAGSVEREYTARLQTTEAQWTIMTNKMERAAVVIGSVLLPTVNRAMTVIGEATTAVVEWGRENQNMVAGVGAAVAAFAGWVTIPKVIGGVVTALGVLKAAVIAHPIGAVVAGLAAGAYLVYKNWEPIKAWFADLWAGITASARQALDWIVGKLEAVGQLWQRTKEFFGFDGGAPSPRPGTALAAPAPAALPALPAVPQMATARGAVSAPASNTVNVGGITINQQPGQDSKALARDVAAELQRQQGIRQRGAMYDGVTSR
ncbi:phage tail tape measure protein [Cupriavidus taiwanensis]|uniref:phage tail tape measure protein n=1 Tax=Cupriavidus taiwanensis TaxID=164546 RepID=UPI00253FC52B|nr:phage tail tape measure protein [Cupriavidus taiwanensis]MDK3021712.1 phage tail tape measure protein [Cupriavidus taiwanensis]